MDEPVESEQRPVVVVTSWEIDRVNAATAFP
jgi:hypothetical protein